MPITFDIRSASPSSFHLEGNGQPLLTFHDSGRSARITPLGLELAWREVLRWGAPFALVAQGMVSLHCSAVSRAGQTLVFIGLGGAGKTTLARELEARGWRKLAEDLSVCDDRGQLNTRSEPVLRDWIGEYDGLSPDTTIDYQTLAQRLAEPARQELVAVSGLFFVEERAAGEDFLYQPLGRIDTFQRLVDYAFGGPAGLPTWKPQFQVFGALARQAPAGVLHVPEGLERMRQALAANEINSRFWSR